MVLVVRSEYIRVTDSDYDVDLMGFIDGWLDGGSEVGLRAL